MFKIIFEDLSRSLGAPSSSKFIFFFSRYLAIKMLKYRSKSLIVVGHPMKKCL